MCSPIKDVKVNKFQVKINLLAKYSNNIELLKIVLDTFINNEILRICSKISAVKHDTYRIIYGLRYFNFSIEFSTQSCDLYSTSKEVHIYMSNILRPIIEYASFDMIISEKASIDLISKDNQSEIKSADIQSKSAEECSTNIAIITEKQDEDISAKIKRLNAEIKSAKTERDSLIREELTNNLMSIFNMYGPKAEVTNIWNEIITFAK